MRGAFSPCAGRLPSGVGRVDPGVFPSLPQFLPPLSLARVCGDLQWWLPTNEATLSFQQAVSLLTRAENEAKNMNECIDREEELASSPFSTLQPADYHKQAAVYCWCPEPGQTQLSDNAFDGLLSAGSLGKLDVYLACYTEPTNIPPCVRIIDPRPFVSEAYFKAHCTRKKNPVALLCDLIRLEIAESFLKEGARKLVWVVDLDTAWQRDVATLVVPERAFDHAIATLPQPRGRYQGGWKSGYKYWMTQYLHKQFDHQWATFPARFKVGSPVPGELARLLRLKLEAGRCQYNTCMQLLHVVVSKYGYLNGILPTTSFAACEPAARNGPMDLSQGVGFKFEAIEEGGAIGVNAYWQSCKNAHPKSTMCSRGSYLRLRPGCYWLRVLGCMSARCETFHRGSRYMELLKGGAWKATDTHGMRGPVKRPAGSQHPDHPPPKRIMAWPNPGCNDVDEHEDLTLPRAGNYDYTKWWESSVFRNVTLESKIGRGAYGQVFSGTHHDHRTCRSTAVAVKVSVAKKLDGFVHPKELMLLDRLHTCPYTVSLVDHFWNPWRCVAVMEKLDFDLNSALAKAPLGAIGLTASAQIFVYVSEAVDWMHGHGVIHRDLHPGNILLLVTQHHREEAGELLREHVITAKVCDFGQALDFNEAHLLVGGDYTGTHDAIVGHLSIMPPEILFRKGTLGTTGICSASQPSTCKCGNKIDVWAIGVNFATCIASKVHFLGKVNVANDLAERYISLLGRVPKGVAWKHDWSVPPVFLQRNGKFCDIQREVLCEPPGGWQPGQGGKIGGLALHHECLSYCPENRSTPKRASRLFQMVSKW